MILEGLTEQGAVVPVQVTPQGRIVAEGIQGEQGIQGEKGDKGDKGDQGSGVSHWKRGGTTVTPETTGDVVAISAGTAALPGLTPVGDPNTGIFSPAADKLGIATGGATRVLVDDIGNVYIGGGPVAGINPRFLVDGVSGNGPVVIRGGTGLSAGIAFYNNDATTNRFFVGQGYATGSDNVAFLLNSANADLFLGTNGSEQARVTKEGYFRLARKGIQFNGDTADANSLDDYEEGTWTPIITPAASGTFTTINTSGTYTKVGRAVSVMIYVDVVDNGTAAGSWIIAGLPFAPNTAHSFIHGVAANYLTSKSVDFYINTLGSHVSISDGPSPAICVTGMKIGGQITYFV